MSEPLISVIVPVYNVESYLGKCLDSIINQSYKDLEIILVDDGSTDSSGSICNDYRLLDERVTVIHKENGGLSDARNTALECVTGEYVSFVDSDDSIDLNYYRYLLDLIRKYDADISICEFKYVNEDGAMINHPIDDGTESFYDQENALKILLRQKPYSNSVSGKLFKTALFDGIRFPVGRIYEDVATTYRVFFNAGRIVFGARPLYFYLKRNGSLSHRDFRPNQMDSVEFAEKMTADISGVYPELTTEGMCRLMDPYIGILKRVDQNKYPEIFNTVLDRVYSIRKPVLLYKETSKKRRFYTLLTYLGRSLFVIILKKLNI